MSFLVRYRQRRFSTAKLLCAKEVYEIVGAALEVRRVLGFGFLEAVYQEALEREFLARRIPFQAQLPLHVWYKEELLRKHYVPDFVCFESVIVELKALERLSGTEEGQVINSLRASKLRVGVLLNFGAPEGLQWKRFVN